MTWGSPGVLLGLLLPLAAAIVLARRRPARDAGGALLRVGVAGRTVAPLPGGRPRRPWLLVLALALAVLGLARPRWGQPRPFAFEQAREVLIAVDLSRSMLVEDADGSRLERARKLVATLLERLPGERVGLIVFAGTAYVQVPLSSDYQIIREFLPLLEPAYMPQGGSDYTGMLRAAAEGFSRQPETDRYLMVLSDGESTTEGWREQLAGLGRAGVRVLAFAIGSEAGGLVPAKGEDEAEPAVISRLQPATLRALAAGSGGTYTPVTADTDPGAVLAATVEQGRRGRYERKLGEARPERYAWFLVPALLCVCGGLGWEVPVRPRLRKLLQAGRAPAVAGLVALAALPPPARGHDDHPGEAVAFTIAVDSTAAQRLLALVEHLSRSGYDAADVRLMAEETLNYGIEARTRHLTLQPGAIRDAIAATLEAERRQPQFANWGYLRARLEELLQPPPEAEAAARKKNAVEARDEEDKPPEIGGRSPQPMTSDGGGQGGPGRSDATMGELGRGLRRAERKPDVAPVRFRPAPERPAYEAESGPVNSVRALAVRSWREAIKDDKPGSVHQALQGKVIGQPAGGRDY